MCASTSKERIEDFIFFLGCLLFLHIHIYFSQYSHNCPSRVGIHPCYASYQCMLFDAVNKQTKKERSDVRSDRRKSPESRVESRGSY